VRLTPLLLLLLLLATQAGGVDITSLLHRSLLSQHFRYGHISCFLTSGRLFSHRIGVLPLQNCTAEYTVFTVRIGMFLYLHDFTLLAPEFDI
jgi:hypothetical protein